MSNEKEISFPAWGNQTFIKVISKEYEAQHRERMRDHFRQEILGSYDVAKPGEDRTVVQAIKPREFRVEGAALNYDFVAQEIPDSVLHNMEKKMCVPEAILKEERLLKKTVRPCRRTRTIRLVRERGKENGDIS